LSGRRANTSACSKLSLTTLGFNNHQSAFRPFIHQIWHTTAFFGQRAPRPGVNRLGKGFSRGFSQPSGWLVNGRNQRIGLPLQTLSRWMPLRELFGLPQQLTTRFLGLPALLE
jgi:hypothetical protein